MQGKWEVQRIVSLGSQIFIPVETRSSYKCSSLLPHEQIIRTQIFHKTSSSVAKKAIASKHIPAIRHYMLVKEGKLSVLLTVVGTQTLTFTNNLAKTTPRHTQYVLLQCCSSNTENTVPNRNGDRYFFAT